MKTQELLISLDDRPIGFVSVPEHEIFVLAATCTKWDPRISCRPADADDVPALRKLVGSIDRIIGRMPQAGPTNGRRSSSKRYSTD